MSNRKRKGTKYERIARKLFQFHNIGLSDANGENPALFEFSNLGNRKVDGKSGATHDMDMHLINREGVHLLGECKCYETQKVSKALMAAFILIVEDIKEATGWNIRPVFVSHKGFQPGAEKLAEYYEIITVDLELQKTGKLVIQESYQSYQYEDIVFHYHGGLQKSLEEEIPRFLDETGTPMRGIEVIRGDGTFTDLEGKEIEMFRDGKAVFRGKFQYRPPKKASYKKYCTEKDDLEFEEEKLDYIEGKAIPLKSEGEIETNEIWSAILSLSKEKQFQVTSNGKIARIKG